MKTGTILRIESGMLLPPELSAKLSKLFPGYTLESYSKNRDLAIFYKERADMLASAFKFILDAYPPNADHKAANIEALTIYLEDSRQACDFNSPDIEDLQESLTTYTARLINALMDGWKWPNERKLKEATACLNEAEQFVIMQEGAEDIATIIPMAFGEETLYVLQWDKRLPPYSDFWLEELERIKAMKAPRTPQWFRDLNGPQQVFISHLSENIADKKTFKDKIFNFLSKWYLQIDPSNKLLTSIELKQIINNKKPFPQWYTTMEKAEQEMLLHLTLADESMDGITTALQALNSLDSDFSEEDLKQVTSLPLWYSLLSKTQQSFLKYSLEQATSVKEAVSFLPSRLRTLPGGPANFRKHHLSVLNAEGNIVEEFKHRIASSHIVSRDVLKLPDAVQLRHSIANLEAVIRLKEKGEHVFVQTLISPSPILDYIPFLREIPPDRELARGLKKAIALTEFSDNPPLIHINHPFNIAKRFYYTPADEQGCMQLLNLAKQQLSQDPIYKHLTEKYEHVLNSGLGTATLKDWNGRELFLSSYEHLLIVGLKGLSYGSCVSGKDRKSIEFIHTDAMLIYKMRYGCFPDFFASNEPRQQFVDIVVDLYTSYHAHQLAGQNAPGSNGIKTPANYWPADISDAIRKRLGENALYEDDRLATNNEVARIASQHTWTKYIKPRKSLAILAAISLGEANCQRFIDALALIINEKQRFKPYTYLKLFSSTEIPKGISEVSDLINRHCDLREGSDSTQHSSAIYITASICQVIADRPLESGNRTATTIEVYDLLRGIIDNPDDIEDILDKLNKLTENAYKQNSASMPRSASEPALATSL